MSQERSCYFADRKRKIDFIIVFNPSRISSNRVHYDRLITFLNHILQLGLQIEIQNSESNPNLSFIKLHAPVDVLEIQAQLHDFELEYKCYDYRPPFPRASCFISTPLTQENPPRELYRRNPNSVGQLKPKKITDSERVKIVGKILSEVKFDENDDGSFGYESLLRLGTINHAYPLHGGPYKWTERGYLNDRQLLAEFWANFRYWYTNQPLYLIGQYFGTEVGFYYSWLGFYNEMLIPASILCILSTLFGIFTIDTSLNNLSHEICDSSMIMCPRCHHTQCKYEYINSTCKAAHLSYMCDNYGTVLNAICISIWSIFFIGFWNRKQAILQLSWNVSNLKTDLHFRPQYAHQTKYRRISPITGELEPYTPTSVTAAAFLLTYSSILLLLIIVILATVSVMIYRKAVPYLLSSRSDDNILTHNKEIVSSITASCISAVFITIFSKVYARLAIKLTNLEPHRTQRQYDESFIYKSYALAFTINYSTVFYLAFFKGRFYTHPGDLKLFHVLGGIGSDFCGPVGCILDLSIQLLIVMLSKIFVNNIGEIMLPIIISKGLSYLHRIEINQQSYNAVENDFVLMTRTRYYIVAEFMELVMQYGLITFFIAAFPLGCLLALINNAIELRLDAFNFTKTFRKPVPQDVDGIGVWSEILINMTYIGVLTNGLLIAFTSQFVPQEVYRQTVRYDLKGFLNWTLSEYDLSHFEIEARANDLDSNICVYPGNRNPPDHPQKYELSHDFWFIYTIRVIFVLIFEHLVMLLIGIVYLVIPVVPFEVHRHIRYQKQLNREKLETTRTTM